MFKSGKILEENIEILRGSELNKQLARNEGEFRIFENIDKKLDQEWLELNQGVQKTQLFDEVPEIFALNAEKLQEELKQKYFIDEVEEVKKDGRGRKKLTEEQKMQK